MDGIKKKFGSTSFAAAVTYSIAEEDKKYFTDTDYTNSPDCYQYFWAYISFYFLVFLFSTFSCRFRVVD